MDCPGIKITRCPYEEPYHLNLWIAASNGNTRGKLEYFCNASDLDRIGKQLRDFLGNPDQGFAYELGSEKPEDGFAFFLSLRIKSIDSTGHCAVIVRLNKNKPSTAQEVTEFSIEADVSDVNRLGELFTEFGRLEHRVLEWRVKEGWLSKEIE